MALRMLNLEFDPNIIFHKHDKVIMHNKLIIRMMKNITSKQVKMHAADFSPCTTNVTWISTICNLYYKINRTKTKNYSTAELKLIYFASAC